MPKESSKKGGGPLGVSTRLGMPRQFFLIHAGFGPTAERGGSVVVSGKSCAMSGKSCQDDQLFVKLLSLPRYGVLE